MWKYAILTTATAIALILAACSPKSQESCGFVQNVYGERISWKGVLPVPLYLHESFPEKYVPALQAAMNDWERTTGKKMFTLETEKRISGPKAPVKDGKNIIYFMSQEEWEAGKLEEQARTSIYWIGDQLKEADMKINGKYSFYENAAADPKLKSGSINMEALLIHELGHVLGLKHKETDGSVMETSLSNNTDRVRIAETDKSALQCEY